MKCSVVVVAAGSGTRMGGETPKQFRPVMGLPLFLWSTCFFSSLPLVDRVVVVGPAARLEELRELCERHMHGRMPAIVAGGARRQDSVMAGVRATPGDSDFVAVQDAARPFPPANLDDGLAAAAETGAAIYAAPVSSTMKRVENGMIAGTVEREGLWAAQTPQLVRRPLLIDALEACERTGRQVTDEAGAVEALGVRVRIVPATDANLKVTTPGDWIVAEAIARAHGYAERIRACLPA